MHKNLTSVSRWGSDREGKKKSTARWKKRTTSQRKTYRLYIDGMYAKFSKRDRLRGHKVGEGEKERRVWGEWKRENSRWKMRVVCRQSSDDTAHSQRSRAWGIHREFWLMRSDVPQLSGPMTACTDEDNELRVYVQGKTWIPYRTMCFWMKLIKVELKVCAEAHIELKPEVYIHWKRGHAHLSSLSSLY